MAISKQTQEQTGDISTMDRGTFFTKKVSLQSVTGMANRRLEVMRIFLLRPLSDDPWSAPLLRWCKV
jgi:hypothetical protein